MKWTTQTELPIGEWQMTHADGILLFGSCFAEHIGARLERYKFRCDTNPYGILYNPMSIATALHEIMNGRIYRMEDLNCHKGVWYSMAHHGAFSSTDAETCLQRINSRIAQAKEELHTARWLILTFGTARIYTSKETNTVAGNCHKLPDRLFHRSLLEVEDIVETYKTLITRLRHLNPDLQVLFTVSPVRHAKDGMHGNQVSKSVLHLSIHKLCAALPHLYYFPAYEIVLDELRDYRFYTEDMLHPSVQAVDYVWQCFSDCGFSDSTRRTIQTCEEIEKAIAHRPFHPDTDEYRDFLHKTLLKIAALKEKMPYLDFQNEENVCRTRLNP